LKNETNIYANESKIKFK